MTDDTELNFDGQVLAELLRGPGTLEQLAGRLAAREQAGDVQGAVGQHVRDRLVQSSGNPETFSLTEKGIAVLMMAAAKKHYPQTGN